MLIKEKCFEGDQVECVDENIGFFKQEGSHVLLTLIKLLVYCFKHSNLVLDTWITEDLQICVSVPLEERDQISVLVYEKFDSAAGSLDAAFDVTLKSSELWLLSQPAHYR